MQNTQNLFGSVLISAALLQACGNETSFSGRFEPPSLDAVPQPSPTPEIPASTTELNLVWDWSCRDIQRVSEGNIEQAPQEVFLKGSGTHHLSVSSNDRINFALDRHHCEPQNSPRDLIFVVDISGSMNQNDRRVNNSCGRFEAIKSILESLQQPDEIRVAVITFSGNVASNSREFMRVSDFQASAFFQSSLICAANGGTNYRAALDATLDILADARPESMREVYFISDGEPNRNQEGYDEATLIKDPRGANATLATLMLMGNDAEMKKIASRDENGRPLHRRTDNASDLGRMLAEVATTSLKKVLLHYRAMGSKDWLTDDVTDLSKTRLVPSLVGLEVGRFRQGIEFMMESIDSRGSVIAREFAQLRWQTP
jgi:uncharacterized protein YegL